MNGLNQLHGRSYVTPDKQKIHPTIFYASCSRIDVIHI